MASDTCLNLVNRVLLATGDFDPLPTVVNSPGNIADRIIHFMNIAIVDLARKIDFPELYTTFAATGDGVNDRFYVQTQCVDGSNMNVTVNQWPLEEISIAEMHNLVETGFLRGKLVPRGVSQYFARISATGNQPGVWIYPVPNAGARISVLYKQMPTLFPTGNDNATTEISDNDLIVLATLAHMDAYVGMERGYMQLYEHELATKWLSLNRNKNLRIVAEDYH